MGKRLLAAFGLVMLGAVAMAGCSDPPAEKPASVPAQATSVPAKATSAPAKTDAPDVPAVPGQVAGFASTAPTEHFEVDGRHHLLVRFKQTPGIWPYGTRIVIALQFDQPFDEWKIDPDGRAFQGRVGTDAMETSADKRALTFKTTVAPAPRSDVIIEIISPTALTIGRIGFSPIGDDPAAAAPPPEPS